MVPLTENFPSLTEKGLDRKLWKLLITVMDENLRGGGGVDLFIHCALQISVTALTVLTSDPWIVTDCMPIQQWCHQFAKNYLYSKIKNISGLIGFLFVWVCFFSSPFFFFFLFFFLESRSHQCFCVDRCDEQKCHVIENVSLCPWQWWIKIS